MANCALCNAPFVIEDGYVKCWRGTDLRYYCCFDHANFGLDKLLAPPSLLGGTCHETLRLLRRKVGPWGRFAGLVSG
jgi:hypothetical protein